MASTAGQPPDAVRVGVAAIGRATFDTDHAAELAKAAFAHVGQIAEVVGSADVITEPEALRQIVVGWGDDVDAVVLIQATFTDARFVAEVAAASPADILIWAFPEERTGGRLALNSLCGLILASFELAQRDRSLRWLHADPGTADARRRLVDRLTGPPPERPSVGSPPDVDDFPAPARERAAQAAGQLSEARIGIVGDPPPGFGPCGRHAGAEALTGIVVETHELEPVLRDAAQVGEADLADSFERATRELEGVDAVDRDATMASLALHRTMDELARDRDWQAVALRCWPETFDQLGCSACAALARLNDDGVPAGCEADALGSLTMLLLGWFGQSRPFLADLVDVDPADDTAVLWHCGVAPAEMAEPRSHARAGVHPNRGVPLTHQLVMNPGVVTVARVSQSRGHLRLVVGRAQALARDAPYIGSTGVVRFELPVEEVLATTIDEGLEHHLGVVYGDCVDELGALAARLEIPVVTLG